jgi:hypothetical protein
MPARKALQRKALPRKAAPSHCSPVRYELHQKTGTCLSADDTKSISKELLRGVPLDSTPPSELLRMMHQVMGTTPGEEERWLASPNVRSNRTLSALLQAAFRPEHPKEWTQNPYGWLSTIDIEQVMHQYQVSHPHFKFVGCFPRDFATRSWTGQCISPPMCNLSVASLRAEGRSEFGIVFNLDKHDQRGSHWTACYGCIDPLKKKRYGIWYYDSVGRPAPTEVTAFMRNFAADANADVGSKAAFKVTTNRIRRQFKGSECGIYALFFIVVCLTTETPFQSICKDIMMDDERMNELRNVFFRAPP